MQQSLVVICLCSPLFVNNFTSTLLQTLKSSGQQLKAWQVLEIRMKWAKASLKSLYEYVVWRMDPSLTSTFTQFFGTCLKSFMSVPLQDERISATVCLLASFSGDCISQYLIQQIVQNLPLKSIFIFTIVLAIVVEANCMQMLEYFIYFIGMQSVELVSKRGGRPRYQRVLNKTREERFNNRYSLNQKAKDYEALSDPYTSYYFANKSVKDHLKDLKRALKYEPNFTEKSRINKLLTLRIKQKFQDVLCPKTSVYEHSLGEAELKKMNEKSRSSLSNKRLDNYFSNKQTNTTPFVLPENPNPKPLTTRKQTQKLPRIKHQTVKLARQIEAEEPKIEANQQIDKQKPKKSLQKHNQQKIIADKLAQDLHHKKHQKWINFLEQKKKILLNHKVIVESPKKEHSEANSEAAPLPTPQPASPVSQQASQPTPIPDPQPVPLPAVEKAVK